MSEKQFAGKAATATNAVTEIEIIKIIVESKF